MISALPVAFTAPGPGGGGGGGGGVTVALAPSIISREDFFPTQQFGPITATVTGGVPSSLTWSYRSVDGGVWTIASGQGTATATAQVSFVAPGGGNAAAEFVCSAVVSGTTYSGSCLLAYTNLADPFI